MGWLPRGHLKSTTINMQIPLFFWLGALSLLSVASCASAIGRGKYESPKYTTVVSDGAFEVRDYPEVVVVSAPMKGARSNQNSAFMTLFRYISGDNENGRKIAMTTPVFGTLEEEGRKMSFVVPSEVVEEGVPAAMNQQVVISKRQAGRFAVYRYSGRWSEARERQGREKLQAWMDGRGYSATGSFEKASYDPPFTPPPLRRNEVLVRIGKGS